MYGDWGSMPTVFKCTIYWTNTCAVAGLKDITKKRWQSIFKIMTLILLFRMLLYIMYIILQTSWCSLCSLCIRTHRHTHIYYIYICIHKLLCFVIVYQSKLHHLRAAAPAADPGKKPKSTLRETRQKPKRNPK